MKKKGLITTCLCAALGVGLTATLASCNNGGGSPTKYTVSAQCDEGCSVSGISTTGYEKGELVSFKVNVTAEHKAVKDVTSADVTITKSLDKYEFSMPEKNVDLKVTLKDSGTLAVTFDPTTVEINEVTTFTVTLDGSALPTGSEVVVKAAGQVAARVEGTNTIKGLQVGEETLTFSVKDKGYEAITAKLSVVKSRYSIDETYEDAVKKAPHAGEKAGVKYKIPGKVVGKGSATTGYGDIVLFDGNSFIDINAGSTVYETAEVGKSYYVEGDVSNYYGFLQVANTTAGPLKFIEDSTHQYKDPEVFAMDYDKCCEYFAAVKNANDKSSDKKGSGMTEEDVFQPGLVSFTAKAKTDGTSNRLFVYNSDASASVKIAYSKTGDETVKANIDKFLDKNVDLKIEGYFIGGNSGSGYINMFATKVEANIPGCESITVSADKTELKLGETAKLTSVVEPAEAALGGITYTANPAEAVTISDDGEVVANEVNEDTTVTITATCGDKSNTTTIKVLAVKPGDVIITCGDTVFINGDKLTLTGEVFGSTTAKVLFSIKSGSEFATLDSTTNEVTGVKEGTVVFTGTNSEDQTKTKDFTVNVAYDYSKPVAISHAITLAKGTSVIIEGDVVAISTVGFTLADSTGLMLVHLNASHAYVVGNYLRVSGTIGEYNKAKQINAPEISAGQGTDPKITPTPKQLTNAEWDDENVISEGIRYVKGIAKVYQSGTSYNFYYCGNPDDLSQQATNSGFCYKAIDSANFCKEENVGKYIDFEGVLTNVASSGSRTLMPVSYKEHIIETTSIDLETDKTELFVNETAQLTATVHPSGAKTDVVYEITAGTDKIEVSETGVVTAKVAGTAKIVAKQGAIVSNEITITIENPPVITVTIEGDMTKKSYYADEDWDPSGLTVKADGVIVTEGVQFTFSPSKPSAGVTSVDVVARYKGNDSAACTISDIVVKEKITISKKITDIATRDKWTVSTSSKAVCYTSFGLDASTDSIITVSTTGQPNCGSYWSGGDWRLYQAKSGNITIASKEGYQISTIKITYSVSNSGTLLDSNSKAIKSDDVVNVDSDSITLTVGNTSTVTNGQVKVSAISVTYIQTK